MLCWPLALSLHLCNVMATLYDRRLPHAERRGCAQAFYKWIQTDFQADAVVHVGMHGTVEWCAATHPTTMSMSLHAKHLAIISSDMYAMLLFATG